MTTEKKEREVWKALETVSDPEIPVLSVVDLNIVHSVEVNGGEVTVTITPTFVGCPALDTIAESIRTRLHAMGFETVRVNRSFVAGWSTDSLGEQAKEKMKEFGIAPPAAGGQVVVVTAPPCPFCGSGDTRIENPFGATLCKKLCYCNSCKQSFEQFRTI
ncbi:MAG TPA: 1,2-phenylacetyl-CoA epoxidase subunit PaaD [Bacteroidota bacterium]|nr:1,2-phenylacetyl-CoA epoxidase subunit PaaD [Bacteroidota bacterium]